MAKYREKPSLCSATKVLWDITKPRGMNHVVPAGLCLHPVIQLAELTDTRASMGETIQQSCELRWVQRMSGGSLSIQGLKEWGQVDTARARLGEPIIAMECG